MERLRIFKHNRRMDVVSKFIGRNLMLKRFTSNASPLRPRLVSNTSHQNECGEGKEEKRRWEDAMEEKESKRGVRDYGEVTRESIEKVSGKGNEGNDDQYKNLRRKIAKEMKESAREKALRRTKLPIH